MSEDMFATSCTVCALALEDFGLPYGHDENGDLVHYACCDPEEGR